MATLNLRPDLRNRLSNIEKSVRGELRLKKVGHKGIQSILDSMSAGLEKHSFAKLIGRGRRPYDDRATAEKLWKFLEGNYAIPGSIRGEISTEFDRWLENQRQSALWRGALSDLMSELGYGGVPEPRSANAMRTDEVNNAGGIDLVLAQRQGFPSGYPTEPEPTDAPRGRNTGSHSNRISELCHAEAEWRDTNLGENEGRWLQIFLRFKRSYTRVRVRGGVELSVHVHRVHVDAVLDGGLAVSRDPWTESSINSGDNVDIFEGNSWTPECPCYEVDNPVRSSPLTGHFDWFDLCEVSGAVGENALLEISVSIGGISIPLPDNIREQLDPSPKHPYDTPELHLIEGWLRHRLVPRSRLKGGLYQLTQIKLQKNAR